MRSHRSARDHRSDSPPSAGHLLRSGIFEIRQQLNAGRTKIESFHQRGGTGNQVCARLTSLIDTIVIRLYQEALADFDRATATEIRHHVALIAVGGYGRRQLAPYSDVDLLILHRGHDPDTAGQLARRLVQDIFDTGLVLGHSVRTLSEALQLARTDAHVTTALIESRIVAGDQSLYEQLTDQFGRLAQRRGPGLIRRIIQARAEERDQFGQTIFLLEPNLKCSRGGLRDIHLLRWLGYLRFGVSDPDQLHLAKGLSKLDHHRLIRAQEFLLRLRNAIHFHAGSSRDIVDRHEQLRLAERMHGPSMAPSEPPPRNPASWDSRSEPSTTRDTGTHRSRGTMQLLPVERLMREYFWHTTQVWNLTDRFVRLAQPVSTAQRMLEPVFSHQVEGIFRVGPREIHATRTGLEQLKGSLRLILQLLELANMYDRGIAATTWSAIHRAVPHLPDTLSADVVERFMALLEVPTRLGSLLRGLHALGVLERILPDFTDARCLLQFNQYHKYTVDEHCIRAVECATEFNRHEGVLRDAYRSVHDKALLHLALLIHDLGKGHTEDHSEVGRRIASRVADRLGLTSTRGKILEFLVHKHLMMIHRGFRRDTRDPEILKDLARQAGSAEILRMLFVFSCADLAAVGPGVLTAWKIAILNDLYQKACLYVDGSDTVPLAMPIPPNLLIDLERTLSEPLETPDLAAPIDVRGIYHATRKTIQFDASVTDGSGKGVFARLAGTLAAQGFDIHSATVETLPSGRLLLQFLTTRSEGSQSTTQARIDEVAKLLAESVQSDEPPKFRRYWGEEKAAAQPKAPLEQRIEIDNLSSATYTIIEVFTFDHRGLLYQLAQEIHNLGLSIHIAKISTYLDQVVDVFYVMDSQGEKITQESSQAAIRQRLLQRVQE